MLSLRCLALFAAAALIAGCSSAPDLAEEISPGALSAPFPDLVPAETLVAEATAPMPNDGAVQIAANSTPPTPEEAIAQQDNRAASLKARAARLRGGEVIDAAAKERLREKPSIEDDAL
jgi:hypothetical protein